MASAQVHLNSIDAADADIRLLAVDLPDTFVLVVEAGGTRFDVSGPKAALVAFVGRCWDAVSDGKAAA